MASPSPPPPPTDTDRHSIAWMLLSIVLYAVNVLILRAAAQHTAAAGGIAGTAFRGAIGLLLVGVVFGRRGLQAGHLIRHPLVLARGAVGAVALLLFYLTIPRLGAGRAVILNLTYPVFGALMAALWIGEPLARRQLAWMLVSLFGLAVFLGRDALRPGAMVWEAVGVVAAILAGGAVVLIRALRHTEHPSTVYASQCLWSLGITLPWWPEAMRELSVPVMSALAAAAVLVGVAQLAMTHAFRSLSVARGSAIQMLLPLLTTLGGLTFFDERLEPVEIAAAMLTLWGTYRAVVGGKEA